jgi:hypothetical protein
MVPSPVTGTIGVTERTLVSPLGGRRCVWYLAEVEHASTPGDHSAPSALGREDASCDFELRDDVGVALVRMVTPRVVTSDRAVTGSGGFDDANAVEEAFLARIGLTSTLFGLNCGLVYCESVLEVGARVTVLGRARYDHAGGRVLVLEADPETGLLLSAEPAALG